VGSIFTGDLIMLWMPQGLKMELAVPTSAIAHGHVHLQVSRLKVDSFNMLQSSKYVLNHLYRTSKKTYTYCRTSVVHMAMFQVYVR
jgi:hypothetical protein